MSRSRSTMRRRSVSPTEAGLELLERLRPALTGLDEALDAVQAFRGTISGTVRINAPRLAATLLIRDILPVVRSIRDGGVTILMIEHIMQAVMTLCEEVYVLAQGRMIASGPPRQVCADPQVIEAYLGKGAAARMRAREAIDA